MNVSQRSSVYDHLRPHLDAVDLIQRLGLHESRVLGSESYCKPLCHDSTSGESLQINLHTGRWNCKACQSSGVYGDLIQLVEYVLTGGSAPSRGSLQGSSDGHRQAIVWLCDQFGIPYDENRVAGDPGLDVVHLFAMAAHEHLIESPDVLAWILEKWGFDQGTVEAYGLGFMPSPLLPAILSEAENPKSRQAFRSSGIGWHSPDGKWHTRFEGRVTFPYLESGRAVYLIGRSTRWTPKLDSGAAAPKYHKLSVHSDSRPYVSEKITNDHLYNEPIMATAESVVVAEGVADAVALSALGVPVVSPVTISFNKVDLERFSRKARESGLSRVEILFDNELSGSGNWAARRAGLQLVERGIAAKILTLPLGDEQQAARDEVVARLGPERFAELERSDPRERKAIIAEAFPNREGYSWVVQQVAASKIDAAEWCARSGAGAAGRFNAIRKEGVDVLSLEIADIAKAIDNEDEASARANAFARVIELAAHIEDRLLRECYAGEIASAAGRGVTKVEVARRIAAARRDSVKPKRKEEKKKGKVDHGEIAKTLVLLPPEVGHTAIKPPPAPGGSSRPGAPAAPPPPGEKPESDHDRYASARDAVARAVEGRFPEESLGEYVSQTITRSMGFTPFRTPEELFLVRGNKRVAVGLERNTPAFLDLLWLASGLTPKKSSHRAYIAAATYFLGKDARRAHDVSWSYVGAAQEVYFPTGDNAGRIIKIEPSGITRTKMAKVRVPAVAGDDFIPFEYVEDGGGIQQAIDAFRWTSISPGDRLVLIYWIACLPLLRRIGTVPIMRIEGGSSSGKTRTVDAVSYLVNGRKSSSVPTAAALVSRMSTEMLTIDDNRETGDVSPAFLGTLLQATHLGAREKRRQSSDTGTVIERVCGALLMNGIEPIHDGRSELASRILTLKCSESMRAPDSPTANSRLMDAIVERRDRFWSEAVRQCSSALALDLVHGEQIGLQIEEIFGETKIGRLSSYLRVMYFAWVSGLDPDAREDALRTIAGEWSCAFGAIASGSLESLLAEELATSVVRYVFAYASSIAEPIYTGSTERRAFDDKFVEDTTAGEAYLGPMRATQIARLARTAGKEMNAPRAITHDLRAGQLERRILDGLGFLQAAGYLVDIETTRAGRNRFTFRLQGVTPPAPPAAGGGDTWVGP